MPPPIATERNESEAADSDNPFGDLLDVRGFCRIARSRQTILTEISRLAQAALTRADVQ
jgi:hypothetical protein